MKSWKTIMEDFCEVYIAELKSLGADNGLTVDSLMVELRKFQPWVLWEQMLVYYGFLQGLSSMNQLAEYCDLMIHYFKRPGPDYELSMEIPWNSSLPVI